MEGRLSTPDTGRLSGLGFGGRWPDYVRHWLTLCWIYWRLGYLSQLQYRVNVLADTAGFLLTQGVALLTMGLIFSQVPQLVGWTFDQVLFIFAFAILSRGVAHTLFDNLWLLGGYVRTGGFDRLLIRPVPVLLQLYVERFRLEGIGEVLLGGVILINAWQRLGLAANLWLLTLAVIFVICGTLIYQSVLLMAASTAFWIIESMPLTSAVYAFTDLAKYPLAIFARPVRVLLTTLVPFAITSYFPAIYLMGQAHLILGVSQVFWIPAFTIFATAVSYAFWRYALRHYESPGT